MKIIKPSYEILPRTTGHDSILMIEKIARICYKSEDKIKEGSAEHMIAKLVDNGHFAMLEHRQIIVEVSKEDGEALYDAIKRIEMIYGQFSYLKISDGSSTYHYIVSGNMRAWFETCMVLFDEFVVPQWMFQILSKEEYVPIFDGLLLANEDKIKSGSLVKSGEAKEITNWNELTISERLIHEQLSVKFIVDRGVSHELVRHRPASFAQESTRYCNYGNSDNGITVIEPCFFDSTHISHTIDRRGMITEPAHYKDERYPAWKCMMETAEKHYLWLVGNGATPQEARTVLPNSLKTEIVVTTTLSHWQHIFNLRAFGLTGAPHPQMKEVMEPLVYELMVSKEYDRIFTNPNTHK